MRLVVAAGVGLVLLAGCGYFDEESTAVDESVSEGCVVVTEKLDEKVGGMSIKGAAVAPPATNGAPRWYYSNRFGGTWVSEAPPDGSEEGSTFAVNDVAADNDPGPPFDAPVLNGATDDDPAAEASRRCAEEAPGI